MQNHQQKSLSTLHYTVVERVIENFQQLHKKNQHTLILTTTEIQSNEKTFQLNALFDVSYKPFSNGQGFLYLHTCEGVFSFVISSNPQQFIQTFKRISK